MEIKESKFKKGQKVRDVEYGDIYTVLGIESYDFVLNVYWYGLEGDKNKFKYSRPEPYLELYVEENKSEKRDKNEKKNNNHYVYNYTCPNCNEILSEVENCNYCPECGTRLDWSRNE